ncbi:MAG: hypothetical protein ABMA64_06690 [Myxococcota bacterium]
MVMVLLWGCLPEQRTVACDQPEGDLCTEWTMHLRERQEAVVCGPYTAQIDACPEGALGTCTVQSRDTDDYWVHHYYSDNGLYDAASAEEDCEREPASTWTAAGG